MAVDANSYGSADDVAALTRRFTNSGEYDSSTIPMLAQVESWIDQVSATLNVLLAEQGFTIPIVQATVALMLKNFVTTQVADLCNYANSAGRFFSEKNLNTGPWALIQKDAADFIAKHSEGIAKIGATRTTGGLSALAFNDVDGSGNAIAPIFSRKQMGTTNTDWDPDQ
jgi:hypothetical protein